MPNSYALLPQVIDICETAASVDCYLIRGCLNMLTARVARLCYQQGGASGERKESLDHGAVESAGNQIF